MSKISAYTEHTAPSGDDDYLIINDGTTTKKVKAKKATGGMLAHGAAVKAMYRYSGSPSTVKYRLIATLPITSTASGEVYLKVNMGQDIVGFQDSFNIVISNHATAEARITASRGSSINRDSVGIRSYIESDSSLSIYIYDDGSTYNAIGVQLYTSGYATLATVTPPNDVTSITTPTGTLSLDTTAGKYANGVPDGNEDWINLTLATSYAGVCRYRRHSDGEVELNIDFSALGTTTDGTAITTTALPSGYRPVTHAVAGILTATISGGSAARIIIDTVGVIKIYDYATSTANWRLTLRYMAEA